MILLLEISINSHEVSSGKLSVLSSMRMGTSFTPQAEKLKSSDAALAGSKCIAIKNKTGNHGHPHAEKEFLLAAAAAAGLVLLFFCPSSTGAPVIIVLRVVPWEGLNLFAGAVAL